MPSITIRRVPLRSTREYGAPPRGFPRVRMTPNGVQMLAAVNGRGAYDANGPKKQRRKARKQSAKARSYSSKARRKGISATKRAKYRRKATKATKKSKKRRKKAEYQSYVKKMARKAGLTRKELIRLLRGEGMSKTDAQCAVDGGKCSTGVGNARVEGAAKEASMILSGLDLSGPWPYFDKNGDKPEIYFDNRKKGNTMAGRKRKRRSGRKAARRGTRKAARRTSRRSRSSSRRRSSGRRRSSKRSRKASRGSSKRRSRGRRGMRRNGSDDFEMNGSDDFEANGSDFEMNGSDFEANPYHENGYEYEANKKKGKKRKSPSKASKFNKKLLKETGLLKDFGPEPVAGMMLDSLADRFLSGQISPEAYKAMRKQVAKAYFPKQEGRGGKIGVTITDPITGKSKTIKVPWKGKVRTAFGPFKRRQKGGMYTYEWEKGEKIPPWALAGAYSKRDFDAMVRSSVGPDSFAQKAADIENRILAARARVAEAEQAELERKIRKLQEKQASGKVDDPMTPNKRGSGRRRGKRRMSAAQKKALVARLQAGKRKARRGGSKRRGRKGGRRKARRSGKRRSGKRRSRGMGRRRVGRKGGRRKARRSGKRRSSRRGKRRGRKGFRKNFSFGEISPLEAAVGVVVGAVGVYMLQKHVSPMILGSSPDMVTYAPALVGTLGAVVTAMIGEKVGSNKDFFTASALSMLAFGGGLTVTQLLPKFGMAGIPYVNTSGWGSRRSVGAYELRGTGAYELRGMGAYPQQALAGGQYAQAMAAYELRGMGAYPQQALAGGQYAQALAGQPYDDELLPSQADAALDWADQQAGGEYVNTQLQPTAPLFFQDSLANLGVPGDMGGGIPSRSIWNPTGEGFVDPAASIGGNFDDPNV